MDLMLLRDFSTVKMRASGSYFSIGIHYVHVDPCSDGKGNTKEQLASHTPGHLTMRMRIVGLIMDKGFHPALISYGYAVTNLNSYRCYNMGHVVFIECSFSICWLKSIQLVLSGKERWSFLRGHFILVTTRSIPCQQVQGDCPHSSESLLREVLCNICS